MTTFECASCKASVSYEGKLPELFPFCSARCKMADLGRWFRDQYGIERELGPDEVPDEGLQPPARPTPRKRQG